MIKLTELLSFDNLSNVRIRLVPKARQIWLLVFVGIHGNRLCLIDHMVLQKRYGRA